MTEQSLADSAKAAVLILDQLTIIASASRDVLRKMPISHPSIARLADIQAASDQAAREARGIISMAAFAGLAPRARRNESTQVHTAEAGPEEAGAEGGPEGEGEESQS